LVDENGSKNCDKHQIAKAEIVMNIPDPASPDGTAVEIIKLERE
jgi:hypothetical protein